MIKTFSTFAGYGGSEFALRKAGIESECVGFSEIDKYAIKCFKQNFPDIENFGDISKINWKDVPDFDLLTGGFPCQDVSIAGKRDLNKGRTILGLELSKALKEKQPKYFLFENVKGLMSDKFYEFRNLLLKSWRDAGYIVAYKVLNSKDFGIPQNRERVWFVGIRKDIYKPFKFQFPSSEPLKLTLADILEKEVDKKYYLNKEQQNKLLNPTKKNGYEMSNRMYNINGIAPSLTKVLGGNQEKKIIINKKIRKLTPKEYFRLMGFFKDKINLDGLSDTQKYKLAGNGWTLRPASDILKNLLKVGNNEKTI